MNRLLLIVIGIEMFSFTSIGQSPVNATASDTNTVIQEHLKKSKDQKIAGIVLFGLGAVAISYSSLQAEAGINDFSFGIIVGSALFVGSTAELSSSKKSKRRAHVLMGKQTPSDPLKLGNLWRTGIGIRL